MARLTDAVIGAVIGAAATLLAPLIPSWVLPSTPRIELVSARPSAAGGLDLVLKNDGRGPGVLTAVRLEVERLRFAPEISAGGYLPIVATYAAEASTIDVHRQTPYTQDVSAGTMSLAPGETARIGVEIPFDARRAGTLSLRVSAVIDGSSETDAVPVTLNFPASHRTPLVPPALEVVKYLREFDEHFDASMPASTFFRIEVQRDAVADKEVLVAVLQSPNVSNPVRIAHVIASEDVETQRSLAEQSLAASMAGEFRSAQRMESTELAWIRDALGSVDHEWGTDLIALAATVEPRADRWLKDETVRADEAAKLLKKSPIDVPSLALAARRLDGPRFKERESLVRFAAQALTSGADRGVPSLREPAAHDVTQRLQALDRSWDDLRRRTEELMRTILEQLPTGS